MIEMNKFGRVLALGAVLGSLAGCDDLLDVSDPSRFTDSDLDNALSAVAVGVEGDIHAAMDNNVNNIEIMSDVMMHSGTWSGWDDIDHGRIAYDNDGRSDGGSGLLRTRFAAQDANARFDRLEAEGQTIASILRSPVAVTQGWTDRLLCQLSCEGPACAGSPTRGLRGGRCWRAPVWAAACAWRVHASPMWRGRVFSTIRSPTCPPPSRRSPFFSSPPYPSSSPG